MNLVLAMGLAYVALQCVVAALRPGEFGWTVGYWAFAVIFVGLAAWSAMLGGTGRT